MMKFRLYFDKDEETKWLNEMSEKGWALERFFAGFYKFAPCESGQYIYQIDFGEKLFAISNEYREFMEDMGVEIIQPWGFWVILRKPASEGEFQLYTDVDSSIEHYSKIVTMFKVAIIVEIICFFFELFAGIEGFFAGYVLACIIGAFIFVMGNALFKTRDIIAQLKERKGEIVERDNRNVSPLLPCGLLLNACALVISESVSHPIKLAVQILAIILMLAGIYKTARNRRE